MKTQTLLDAIEAEIDSCPRCEGGLTLRVFVEQPLFGSIERQTTQLACGACGWVTTLDVAELTR